VRSVVVPLALVLGSCATVTRTETLESAAARDWLSETANQTVDVGAPGDVAARGRVIAATAGAVHLEGGDGRTLTIPVRDGTTLRQQKRVAATLLGAATGIIVGLGTGFALSDALGSPNPDSAGGKEHPVFLVPVGMLAGIVVGAITGAVVGMERRLEISRSGPAGPGTSAGAYQEPSH
jgi:hypothetical protein